jgi:hypothetical protein
MKKLGCLNKKYCKMVNNVLRLRFVNFSSFKTPQFNDAKQTITSSARVDLATACAIHYGLNLGMVICYLKGKYVGENQDAEKILSVVSPHISNKDSEHIR